MPKLVGFERKYSDSLEKHFEAAIHSGHSRWIGLEGKLRVEKLSLDQLSTLSRDSASADYPRSCQSVLEKLLDNYRLVTPMDQPKNGVNRAFQEREVNTIEYASICQQLRHDLIEYLRLLRPQPTPISKIDEASYRQHCQLEIPWFCTSAAIPTYCGLPFIDEEQEITRKTAESDDSDTFSVGSLLEEMGLERHAAQEATLKELTNPTPPSDIFYPLERMATARSNEQTSPSSGSPTSTNGTIPEETTPEAFTKRTSVDKSMIEISSSGRKRADSNLVKDIFHASSSGRRLSRSERSQTKVAEVQPNSQKPVIMYVDADLSSQAVLVDIDQNQPLDSSVPSENLLRPALSAMEPTNGVMSEYKRFATAYKTVASLVYRPKRPPHMRTRGQLLFRWYLYHISYLPYNKCSPTSRVEKIFGLIVANGWIPMNLRLIECSCL
ncbi:hypothetical protein K493DRAFT_299419 [Basidiobolus meristosporus CBS 931.73]|uniref:Uncharacterized protein n=1 Tax=Basidiobolus meristosporus CBS 931.73 TaxID=1314790 RepID=A0A1Y1YN30_9FUNG|nr:hypothetical protein K493DRAFT_299419 [Basidiobolus meristosporus CBS 931.73]|eukprot:ORX99385.1 hypothetical protein K493DRAFT_299419 [Basidiobolus meristosporus CBS 931.73]